MPIWSLYFFLGSDISVAIIGARTFTDYQLLQTEVEKQCSLWNFKMEDIKQIVGGHCIGADLLGEKFAQDHGIKTLVFEPDWKRHGKSAGFKRNRDIIDAASHVIAFPSKNGGGTQHSIKLAHESNKPCHVVPFDA